MGHRLAGPGEYQSRLPVLYRCVPDPLIATLLQSYCVASYESSRFYESTST